MRTTITPLAAIAALLLTLSASAQQAAPPPPSKFKLMSPAFAEGTQVPTEYTCAAGAFISPPLTWSDAPQGTVSLAMIFHDTDAAPRKGVMDVTHWILWNVPAGTMALEADIKAGASPHGIRQGKNIRGADGYQGPCPPPGATPHHYIFELYALDQTLDLAAGSTRDELLSAMDGHVIGKATYVGVFSRQP